MTPTIEYHADLNRIQAADLDGFFVGWPQPPSPQKLRAVLAGSTHFLVAVPAGETRVVGFITAISDGVLAANIPLLEVHPDFQGHGIGSQLVTSMLNELRELYMVDLSCDPGVQPFYARLGMSPMTGMALRNYEALD